MKPVSLPPTAKMIETLMECHERELLGLEPCTTYNTRYTTGLFKRGLFVPITFTDSKGKKHLGFSVTEQGKEFLKNYCQNK